MKLINIIIPFCYWLPGHGCSKDRKHNKMAAVGLPPIIAEQVESLRDRVVEIGHEILLRENFNENSVVSPLSIVGALYMLAAATSGDAQDEVLQLLNISKDSDAPFESYKVLINYLLDQNEKSYMLNLANGLFYQAGFTPQENYSRTLESLMQTSFSDIRETDFASNPDKTTDEINDWVNDKTNGKISKLFEKAIHPNTIAMLLSSLYFKASWEIPFDIIKHKYYCWNNAEACSHDVQFMSVDNNFNTYWGKDFTVVDVPMTLVATKDGDESNDDDIEKLMTFQIWIPENVLATPKDHHVFQQKMRNKASNIQSEMKMGRINLVMPTLSLEFKKDLKKAFMDMGVQKVFEYGPHFDSLFGKDQHVEAAVSEIRHAVKLDIDEDGIEGAATTAIGMMFRSMPPDVVADRPFYFTIASSCRQSNPDSWPKYLYNVGHQNCAHDRTPIFVGKVVNGGDDGSK